MKIIDIINSKNALAKLNKVKFNDFNITLNIYKLIKKVNDILDAVQQEQDKLIEMYTIIGENGRPLIKDNQYQFPNIENRNAFIENLDKIKNTEINDIEKIDISADKVQVVNDLTSEEMMLLEPFINWIY